MDYYAFRNKVQKWPLVTSRSLTLHKGGVQSIRNQLERWRKKRLLVKLRRGVYLLNQNDRKINPSRNFIANQLYNPSYVSLESALSYYDLIPERVSDVTSVAAKKTLRLENELGVFIYQHIKPDAFRGFNAQTDEAGLFFFIAEPEKALIDFCYLNLDKFKGEYETVFEESYRLQNIEILNAKKPLTFTKLFNSQKLTRVIKALCGILEKEKRPR
jgi:predicted transcriptional regulator of viral defense system